MKKIIISLIFHLQKRNECWTPGTEDVDCEFEDGQTGFGLCCFNGCGNTCYQKNETKCTMESHQECHDETVTEMSLQIKCGQPKSYKFPFPQS